MRSLQEVCEVLSNPGKISPLIELLRESDPMLARLGGQLGYFQDKELGSTLTSVSRHLRTFSTPAIAESTSSSDFDPSELRNGKTTVYVVLPVHHQRAAAGWTRMIVGTLLRAVIRGGLERRSSVHFILDEAASLGHMDCIDDAIDKYRGYGVRAHFFFQAIGQLKKFCPTDGGQTLLANVTPVFFGVNDPDTAEYVSRRLGDFTAVAESGGTGSGASTQSGSMARERSHGHSSNENENWNQVARKLLKSEEVMGLSDRVAITFVQGLPPIWTRLERYYEGRIGPARFGRLKALVVAMLVLATGTFSATIATLIARSMSQ